MKIKGENFIEEYMNKVSHKIAEETEKLIKECMNKFQKGHEEFALNYHKDKIEGVILQYIDLVYIPTETIVGTLIIKNNDTTIKIESKVL